MGKSLKKTLNRNRGNTQTLWTLMVALLFAGVAVTQIVKRSPSSAVVTPVPYIPSSAPAIPR